MIKLLLKLSFFLFFGATLIFGLGSCDPLEPDPKPTEKDTLGWYGIGPGAEDTANINNDIQFGSGTTLPSSIDLYGNFPPIGNQGQYGTCVAWAVGYNHRTYLNAQIKGWSTSDLSSTSRQFSAKSLFLNVPSSQRGDNCGGTGFEPAYDVMQSKGISTLAEVPYTDLGDCSGSAAVNADYKVLNYRQITHTDKNVIKQNLAEKKAVVFGAKLGDEFMNANSSAVLSAQTYGYSGQHAYHAMILCGYDDRKGPNGAFRVVNSWGTGWGDNGFLWVDENFFCDEFCFCAFVARSADAPPGGGGDDDPPPATGNDLMAWELGDYDNGGGVSRVVKYNVFNSGTTTITASNDWDILYVCYNAHDANDYEVILYDHYSDDDNGNGEYAGGNGVMTNGGMSTVDQGNWWNWVDVESEKTVAYATLGTDPSDRFSWQYDMPTTINGEYYLVMLADGFNKIDEVDEDNNNFFLTTAAGDPITITNGVIQGELSNYSSKTGIMPGLFAKSAAPTSVNKSNLNAYTPEEILGFIKHEKESGRLMQKALKCAKRTKYKKQIDRR